MISKPGRPVNRRCGTTTISAVSDFMTSIYGRSGKLGGWRYSAGDDARDPARRTWTRRWIKGLIGQIALGSFLLLLPYMSQGCQQKLPPAAASNQVLTPEEGHERRLLTDQQAAEVLAAMRSVAQEHVPADRPHPAPHGIRWSDMHASIIEATIESEMAVTQYELTDKAGHYLIRTVDGRPGRLEVVRRDDELMYDATASIGRFGDPDAEAMLLNALRRHLLLFGTKRRFNDD